MKGLHATNDAKKIVVGFIALLAMQLHSAQAAYTMSETCQYYPEGYIANPSDCQGWGYCSGGVLTATGKCGAGYLYDSQAETCNYASNVKCGTTVDNICKNLASPGFIADPANCNRYCYCANSVTQCHFCPTNQFYNPNVEECVYDYTCPADSVCKLVPNNKFVGNPNKCGEYIRCVGGSGQSQACDGGLFFNPINGKCQASNPCTSNPGTGPTGTTTMAPSTSICTGAPSYPYYFADGQTCYGYYTCKADGAKAPWSACPFSTQFNEEKQACVTPYTFACTKNRCGNINIPFVAVPGSECKKYYICTNQQQGTVPKECTNDDYPYIDEVNGGCVQDEPDYGICQS